MSKTKWGETLRLWIFTCVNIPLIFWIRPRVLELNHQRSMIRIPLNRRTRNHLRSMYFGGLCIGADLAPGLLTMYLLRKQAAKCSFLFKDFQADFHKRFEDDVYFTCEEGTILTAAIQRAVQTKERENVTLNVIATVPSVSGTEPVGQFKLTISLKAKS